MRDQDSKHADSLEFFQVVYMSTALDPWSEEELKALLGDSRRKNEERDVTGILLYHEGVFFQVLEGECEVIEALCEIIKSDERHHSFRVIHRGYHHQRLFPEWTMGFFTLGGQSSEVVEGFNDFLSTRDQMGDHHKIYGFLNHFKDLNSRF